MRYQPKGLLHAPRFTMKPRDCNVCGKPLPIPHPTSKRTCDACLSDPVRIEEQRQKQNKQERDRYVSKRQPIVPVMRTCQHREKKNGPICGVEFEAKPRIDKDGLNRGVHADQVYCPKHQTPKAVARRRWLNRNVENYKRLQRAYRNRNLERVRKYQREAARTKRDELKALRLLAKKVVAGEAVTVGADRVLRPKGGRPSEIGKAARVNQLRSNRAEWPAIQKQIAAEFRENTTINSLQRLLKRHLAHLA